MLDRTLGVMQSDAHSLEVVFGEARRSQELRQLAGILGDNGVTGTFYIGYPIISTADERISIEGLLVSDTIGAIAFAIADPSDPEKNWPAIQDRQESVYGVLESYLGRHKSLRHGRRLAVPIDVITVFPDDPVVPSDCQNSGIYCSIERVVDNLPSVQTPLSPNLMRSLRAALQRVATINPPKKRAGVKKAQSRGSTIKAIELQIANQDKWQKRAAIETPDGPQRIRGLAGSGKTVVLALKAAYLHATHPEWNIAVTFHTQSLYRHLTDLIRRFSFEQTNDEPDWSKLQILHSWGSNEKNGVYRTVARASGATFRDWNYAKNTYHSDPFDGICRELHRHITTAGAPDPIFDAVLIDEAQDLPKAFFRLIYEVTKSPKRIVWAYDELQKLTGRSMPSTIGLFGKDASGTPIVDLANEDKKPQQDVILPVCYRNPPWTLAVAHALGFGIYKDDLLVQHFDDPSLWKEVGYQVISGNLEHGSQVDLVRSKDSYPSYFEELLDPEDAVRVRGFASDNEMLDELLKSIHKDLSEELDPDDILIVLPDVYTSKSRAQKIMRHLDEGGIISHHAGVTSDRDRVFLPGSVSIAHIHRAKGNEAPMVYVVDAEYCTSGAYVAADGLATLRSILFTAITRSRCWVRVFGHGERMKEIETEFSRIVGNNYHLRFQVPTPEDLRKMRSIHRDRSPAERQKIDKVQKDVKGILKALDDGTLAPTDLPDELRERLLAKLGKENGKGSV